ncbi:MAG: mechanosensitive ion channel [Chromatiales bacterium]|nr:mechanosensitive ion channel [Chromatiales bacterium]
MIARLRIASLVAALAVSSVLHAQAPAEPVREAAAVPSSIDVAEIPVSAERLLADLALQEERLRSTDVESQLETELETLEAKSLDIQQNKWALRPEGFSNRARSLYKKKWQALQAERESWGRSLDKEVASLQEKRIQLKSLQQTWESTLQEYPGEELAAALQERITTVLSKVSALDKEYASAMSRLSTLYQDAQPGNMLIRDALNQFDVVERQNRSRMLAIDSAPLWQVFGEGPEVEDLDKDRVTLPMLPDVTWTNLSQRYRTALIVHGLVLVALLWLTLSLARRRKQWKEKEFLSKAVLLFSAPVSMAVLMALLTSAIFYTSLPLRFQDARSLLIAVFTVLVLQPILRGRIRKLLYISIALFVATKLVEFANNFSIIERLGLLAVNLAAAWFVAYLSKAVPAGEGESRWWRWVSSAARWALPLLGVGVVSNVLGNVSLAETITMGTVYTMTAGVVLAAGVLILEITIEAILHVRAVPQLKAMHRHRDLFQARAFSAIQAVGFIFWLNASLSFFNIRDWVIRGFVDVISHRVQLGNMDLSAMDLIAFGLSLYVATLLSRFIRFLLEEEVYQRVQMPRGLPNTVSMLVNYGILAIGFFVAISVAGIDLSRFAIVAGALGVGIGFGLQNVVNNFVSGLILMFERPIQVGDTIEVGVLVGHVLRIGFRSSTVRTYDGAEVIVPNGNLISSEVVNWTLSDRTRRLDVPVGVAYGSDPQKVLDVLTAAAQAHKDVLPYPTPSIIFKGFGDSSLDFSVRVWIKDFEEFYRVSSELAVLIYAALNQAGFEIPFPQRDLHLRSVSPGISLSGHQPGGKEGKEE